VRFIRDVLDIDVEMPGNNRADFVDFVAFTGGCSLSEVQATEGHGQPPDSLSAPHSTKHPAPQCGAFRKI
jgi:hypothetical protein